MAAHAGDLVGGLDAACALHRLLGILQRDAELLDRCDAGRPEPVDGEPAVRTAMFAHQRIDLARPPFGRLGDAIGLRLEVPGRGLPRLGNGFGQRRGPARNVAVEQDHGTVGGNERVAIRTVLGPDLHVPRSGRIADVDGVEQHAGAVVEPGKLIAQTGQPVAPQPRHVDPVFGIERLHARRIAGDTIAPATAPGPGCGRHRDGERIG